MKPTATRPTDALAQAVDLGAVAVGPGVVEPQHRAFGKSGFLDISMHLALTAPERSHSSNRAVGKASTRIQCQSQHLMLTRSQGEAEANRWVLKKRQAPGIRVSSSNSVSHSPISGS